MARQQARELSLAAAIATSMASISSTPGKRFACQIALMLMELDR